MNRLAMALVGVALLAMQIGCTCCCRPSRCQSVCRTGSGQADNRTSDYYTVADRPSSKTTASADPTLPPLPGSLQIEQVTIPRAPLSWGF